MKPGRLSSGELNLDGDRESSERALHGSQDLSSLTEGAALFPAPDPAAGASDEMDVDEQLRAYRDQARGPKQKGFPPLDALNARLGEFPLPIQHAESSTAADKKAAAAPPPSGAGAGSNLAWFELRFSELKEMLAGQQVEKGDIVSINAKLAEIVGRVDRLSSAMPGEQTMAAVETQLAALRRSVDANRNQGYSDADRIARAAKEILAATERAEEARAGFENAARHTVRELGQTVKVAATTAAAVTAQHFASAQRTAQEGGLARVEQQLRDLNAHSKESSERTTAALERVHDTLRDFLEKDRNKDASPKKRAGVHMPISADAPAYSRPGSSFGAEPAPKPQLGAITLRTPPPQDPNLLRALQEASDRLGAKGRSPQQDGDGQRAAPAFLGGPLFREEDKALPLFGLGVVAFVLLIASAALLYLHTKSQVPPFHLTMLPDLQNARVVAARAQNAPPQSRAFAVDGPEKLLTAKSKEGPALFTAADQAHTTSAAKTEPSEDLQTLTTAASRGDREAQFRIGARFLSDGSAQSDPATAARWLARAAEQGHTESQFVLASLYERGAGVPKDEFQARELYRKAAAAQHPRAMHNLGVLLAAQDTDPDYQEAAMWFSKAAAAGVTDSQYNLALLYERGLGVQQDNREAYFWYQVASLAGDKEAGLHAEQLKRQLPDDVTQAEGEKAGSWRPAVERLSPRLGADRG